MSEHEHEPVPGLPGYLPDGERILWQGSPSWRALAVRALHARKVAVYFALLAAWHVAETVHGGASLGVALRGSAWLVVLGASGVTVLATLAWAMARTTMYTITSARVVLRFGVALPMSVNLPFRVIESAAVRLHRDGTLDLPLTLLPGEHMAYLLTWPHVRPWHFLRVQPMLRALPDGRRAAEILAGALAEGLPAAKVVAAAPRAIEPANRPAAPAAA